MKWKVLVTAPYMQPVIDRFRPVFHVNDIEIVVPSVKERLSEEELLSWIGDIDGVIAGDDFITEKVLKAAPRLKVISKWGTGVDSIDLKACQRLCIVVGNTPNAFSEPVADSVMGYILCFARQLLRMDCDIRSGFWLKRQGISLRECTLGVIGVGNVGKAVVRRATAFGMRVLGNDLVDMPPKFLSKTRIKMVGKEELLRVADYVSLNCTLNPTSFHLMGNQEFLIMKPTAFVINTARGPIIEEAALVRSLQGKQIAGAALDVFEVEPLPENSPFRQMENVLLAPHNSNTSPQAWEQVHQNTIRNLLEGLKKAER
jgi:D-3-phosphoglycerate dehydrogenase